MVRWSIDENDEAGLLSVEVIKHARHGLFKASIALRD